MDLKDLYPAALLFILIAVMLAVGLTVLSNVSTQVRATANYSSDLKNVSNTTCTAFTNSYVTTTSVSARNLSVAIPASCFTYDQTGNFAASCVRVTGDTPDYNCSSKWSLNFVNFSYTYGATSNAQTAVDSTVTAVGQFPTWFTIIVVILCAAVIIGVVMRSFSGRK